MDTPLTNGFEPIAEGAHARAIGRPKDAYPYPAGSPERKAWLDGHDGTSSGLRAAPSRIRPDPVEQP